ncbi:MAG: UTP--glucose-1-phosphate uridylyltransferase [Hyphobacterium sp.]|nr:MAG: UTP--glucose-1-phosphate uridylyltransferase [Hyphobacterium sp.]
MKKIRKAVLPVAGLGTRVLPATKSVPKEMLPVFDRPAIQYVVNEAFDGGIEHIVFVTGRNKSAIDDHFDRAYELESSLLEKEKSDILHQLESERPIAGSMSFVRQQSPLGLGHAVWCARDVIGNEPFAVLLPDVLVKAKPSCIAQMIGTYNKRGGNIIAVEPIPRENVNMYGIIEPKERDGAVIKMAGMIEKPAVQDAPSNLSITGRYILQPEIFDLLNNQTRGAGGEIQLTDAMATLMRNQDFFALEYEGESFDCGSKQGYLRAFLQYALDHEQEGDAAHATLRRVLANNTV